MKKCILFFCIFFVLEASLFCQKSVNIEQSQQKESFSWQPVENAGKYQITIEHLKNDGTWEKSFSKQTRSTSYSVSLAPGHYRMSVSTYNILGKKSATSEWTEFKVIDGAVPYLFNNFFEKSKEWKSPVLFINVRNIDLSEKPDSKNYIHAEKGFEDNSFFIKGKNIFSDDTRFFLVPEKDSSKNAVSFPSYSLNREEIELSLIQRNERKSGVYLSYNPDKLFSGYYLLEARKNGNKDSVEILVIADRYLELYPCEFEVDSRYKVNCLTPDDSGKTSFFVEGSGFSSMTEFFMQPTDGAIPYTYASQLPRQPVTLKVSSRDGVSTNGNMKIGLECDTSLLKSGYYNVVARNSQEDTGRFLVLVEKPLPKSADEHIGRISSKYNKLTQWVDFSLVMEEFSSDMKFTLISSCTEQGAEQTKIPLNFWPGLTKNKYIATVNPELLLFGYYMLMIETKNGTYAKYFSIDNHYTLHSKRMNDAEIAKLFLPRENDAFDITLDAADVGILVFENDKVNVFARFPKIMPFVRPTGGADTNFFGNDEIYAAYQALQQTYLYELEDESSYDAVYEKKKAEYEHLKSAQHVHSDLRLQFDVLNLYWLALGFNLKLNPHSINNVLHIDFGPELTAKFLVDERISKGWELFVPYIGGGIGWNIIDRYHQSSLFDNDHDIYSFLFAGFTLFKLYEISYQIEFHNLQSPSEQYIKPMQFNLGVRLPLRRTYYEQNVVSKRAVITQPDVVDVSDYDGIDDPVITAVKIEDGALGIGGMEGLYNIEKIELPSSVLTIEQNAFKNCRGLKRLTFSNDSKLTAIKSCAFENTNAMLNIVIPESVMTIEKDAFKGWTSGQQIILTVTKEEAQNRNYQGLTNVTAIITYKDSPSKITTNTPFEDSSNFSPLLGIGYSSEPFFVVEQNFYTLSLAIKGHILNLNPLRDLNVINEVISQSPQNVLDYFKSGNKLSFKVFGDGKKYNLYVRTKNDGVFYYDFDTKKGKISQIEIPYSKLQKAPCSKVRSFNKDDVTGVLLIPVYDEKVSNAYFLDFKVE